MQKTYQRSISPSKKQKLPPPPTAKPRTLTIELHKKSSKQRLGVRFHADSNQVGAVIESVDAYGPAWLAKLRPGDVLLSIVNNGLDYATPSGYRAAEVLRPLSGSITARVVRKRVGVAEAAALRIQAAAVGHAVRLGYCDAKCAALCIQTHFRRWLAVECVLEALLALRHIQGEARELIHRQRQRRSSPQPSRSSIRRPACLDEEDL